MNHVIKNTKQILYDFLYQDVLNIILEYIKPKHKNEKKIAEFEFDLSEIQIIGITYNKIYVIEQNMLVEYSFSNDKKILLSGPFCNGLYLEWNNHFLLIDPVNSYLCIYEDLSIINKIICSINCELSHDDDYIYIFEYNNIITKLSYNYQILNVFNLDIMDFDDRIVPNMCNGIAYISRQWTTNTDILDTKNNKRIFDEDDSTFTFVKTNMKWDFCKIYKGITPTNIFIYSRNKLWVFDRNYNKLRNYDINIGHCRGIIVTNSNILIIGSNKFYIFERL